MHGLLGLNAPAWMFYRTHRRRAMCWKACGLPIAGSLEGVFHGAGGTAPTRQRPSLTGVAGLGGSRPGGLDGPDATVVATGEPGHATGARMGRALPRSLAKSFEQRCARMVVEAFAYHEARPPVQAPRPGRRGRQRPRPARSLVLRLRNCQASGMRCLHEPEVAFTRN